ncbi:MAG: hypothetical protein Q9188_004722 [Gyalolechia gomerana]
MANGYSSGTILGPDLSLTPDQQSLLQTALSSNNPATSFDKGSPALNMSPSGSGPNARNGSMKAAQQHSTPQNGLFYRSPSQDINKSLADSFPFDDSPFTDGQDWEDGNFDWENSEDQLFGDLPEASGHDEEDIHDKRKNGEIEDGKNKRHEGNDKNNKKPGRKPLNSSEPTTKRKAQNRAAQRAFRERKERHLKDLEAKVEDLEKASEATNHENGRLRATVDRLSTEVKEYRKRLSLNSNGYSPPAAPASRLSDKFSNNNDFQFTFPKFGDLPGSTFMNNGSLARIGMPSKVQSRTASRNTQGIERAGSTNSSNSKSPTKNNFSPVDQQRKSTTGSSPTGSMQASPTSFQGPAAEDLSGLFSPSILASASHSNSADYMFPVAGKSTSFMTKPSSIGSMESPIASNPASNKHTTSSTSITASPSVSSISHAGMGSSSGTTPEPSSDSPEHRKSTESALNTINEESVPRDSVGDKNTFCDEWASACCNTMDTGPSMSQPTQVSTVPSSATKPPASDIHGIDWMARQNGGQFDPILFGDYRDTQNDLFTNDFFNDAFLNQDFTTPFNMPEELCPSPKKDLMQQVEEQQNAGNSEVIQEESKHFLDADKLWARVQQSQKAQSGEIDMDNLCSQLKAKAKCSGTGAVVEKKDADAILGPSPEDQGFGKMFK